MLTETSQIMGLQVYTNKGVYLGNISNLIVDVDECKISELYVRDTNPLLVEDSVNVSVPYRWIQSIGDVVILKYFPKRVSLKKKGGGKES